MPRTPTTPRTPYEAVLHAARDVTGVPTALDAELLGAALLGSVYAVAEAPRQVAVNDFVAHFLSATARRRTAAARAIRSVFAALVPEVAGGAGRAGAAAAPWVGQLGRVRTVGTWAYGDVFGDQTSYLAVFAYDDPETGGGEHAVVVLVDHNVGIVKDLFVGRPAEPILDEVRASAAADELTWFTALDAGALREQVSHFLEITDSLRTLPAEGELATDRVLVGARLATLPVPGRPAAAADPADPAASRAPSDPGELVPAFLASPEAAGLDRADPAAEAALQYTIRLIIDFARESPDADPLRWSPAVVGLLLLDWVHRRAVLDADDVAMLPPVLRAWTAWAATRRGLPPAGRVAIRRAIDEMSPEFARLHGTGERRPSSVRAATRMLAEGVDIHDEAAVGAWLARQGDDPSTSS
jgi:hypothetical protein